MKKNALVIIFLSQIVYCQTNILVTYNLKITNESGLFKNNEFLNENLNNVTSNDKDIKFILNINDDYSKFYFDAKTTKANQQISDFALTLGSYSGIVYNIKNDSILKQISILGDKIFIIDNSINNWDLVNETKYIDKYLCFKAMSEKIVKNEAGVFKFPIVAWYCPSLPYQYGPNGYGNLPGLILELQVRNSIYGVKNILFEKINESNIFNFKNIKILSSEQLELKLKEFNGFDELKNLKE
ncbi:GLPGLI family protein [Flavobacterium sp.]|uniref:GLPGLI family protein n=1 Tax=Flavobacterium sp. TaxID=239 RepID=UPI003751F1B8